MSTPVDDTTEQLAALLRALMTGSPKAAGNHA
jgi:hypothetical protein